MKIILIISGLVLMLGILLVKRNKGFTQYLIVLIGAKFLLLGLIVWPVSYFSYKADIRNYHVVKDTIEIARGNKISDIERAALINQIIDINKNIADARYWNDTIFDDSIPDEYAELEFLK